MKGVRTGVRTVRIYARCLDCGRTWATQNALGVAARHSAAYGHTVMGERQTAHTYVPEGRPS